MRQFLPHVFALAFAAVAASPGFAQDAQKETQEKGLVKVCKAGGPGVAAGMQFTFSVGDATLTVPSGAPPGGLCKVGPAFPVGKQVDVTETVPEGHTVSSIVVAPANREVSTNLPGHTASVTVGAGITVVTFTDKRTGFVEICKTDDVAGNFKFTVNPGSLGPFTVPAGACSPSIEVAAGEVVIHEHPSGNAVMSECKATPETRQHACDTNAQTSTVTVEAGDVSRETIAYIHNKKKYASITKRFVKSDNADRGTFVTTVKNEGVALPAGTSITVTETLPAGLTFAGFSGNSSATWSCTPALPVAGAATLACKYTGAYPVNSGATLPDLGFSATAGPHADDAKSCASVAVNGNAGTTAEGGPPACAPF